MDTYYVYSQQLTVGYDGVPLIRDIEIGVRRGEILTLIGPNGSGKSTILKSMIRQLRILAGVVVLDGQSIASMTERDMAKKLAIVMTERMRAELMTCYDVVATGRYPYTGRLGILSAEDRRIVDEAIAMVHAESFADRPFSQISDGQRQRLLLARAIAQEPQVVVLDEPTSFLDVRHKLELLDILKTMVRTRNVAVIMSLHELDLAQKVSDRVVCVAGDHIDRCGIPETIFEDAYVRSLYGIEKGSYNALFGCLEMPRVEGEPRLFVIGGGGGAIGVYRRLQRCGVPFAAGVLQENDVEYTVASELAAETVSVGAFSPVAGEAVEKAAARMEEIGRAICRVSSFGEGNEGNRLLRDRAAERGILLSDEDFERFLEEIDR